MTTDTLAQSVADALRQAIHDGVYTCGDRLVELGIAQEMNVSQATARDALYILEREGWTMKKARHGVTMRAFTRDEAEEVYALWAAVSALALGWALENIPRSRLMQALSPSIQSAREHLVRGSTHGALAALFEFHDQLADGIGGRVQTAELLMRLRNQALLLEITREKHSPRSVETWEAEIAAYEKLLGVIKFGDSYEAKQAIRRRLEIEGEQLVAASY